MRVQQTDSFYSPEQNRIVRESSALRKQTRRNNQSFNPSHDVYQDYQQQENAVEMQDQMQAQLQKLQLIIQREKDL